LGLDADVRKSMAMKPRLAGRGGAALVAGGAALLALGIFVAAQRGDPPPAPPETLARISEKNREAAIEAAARMKADSAAASRDTEAKLKAEADRPEQSR
jgi:hypothetical protein